MDSRARPCTYHRRTVTEFLTHVGYEKTPTRLAALTRSRSRNVPVRRRVHDRHAPPSSMSSLICGRSCGIWPPPVTFRQGLRCRSTRLVCIAASSCRARCPGTPCRHCSRRSTARQPMGRRDYAMFLLIATYGLRACEVVTLTLDDVEWRAARLRIPQRKTRGSLWLPLTDEVGTALLDYLAARTTGVGRAPTARAVPRRAAAVISGAISPAPDTGRRAQTDGGDGGVPGRGRSAAAWRFRSRAPIVCGIRMRCTSSGRASR